MNKTQLVALWEEHLAYEFKTHDPVATVNTMVDDPYVNHVPTLTGGHGREALLNFYAHDFIPCMPPDLVITPVSRTVGDDGLADEMVLSFTHTVPIPWMLPDLAPTNKPVRIAVVALGHFRDGKLAHEHIYWDQASVLKQIGLLNDPALPVRGVETAEKVLNPALDFSARHSG